MIIKDSVMALKDNSTKEKTYFHKDDSIFNLDINNVLLGLQTDSDLYKNPTKEQLQKSLKKLLDFYMETLKEDFKFYALNVIPEFIDLKGVEK